MCFYLSQLFLPLSAHHTLLILKDNYISKKKKENTHTHHISVIEENIIFAKKYYYAFMLRPEINNNFPLNLERKNKKVEQIKFLK